MFHQTQKDVVGILDWELSTLVRHLSHATM